MTRIKLFKIVIKLFFLLTHFFITMLCALCSDFVALPQNFSGGPTW